MYLPSLFAERDPERLRAFLESHSFGALIAPGDPPEVAHVPFALIRERDALWGHVARANPVWRLFDGRSFTAVFQGPHGYISPRFYVSKQQVPTWNYAVVHVRGAPRVLERDDDVQAVLSRLTSQNEGLPEAWSTGQLDPAFYADLRRAIVAFELPMTEVVGKFKLSQNREPQDREGVIKALTERGSPDDAAMLRWMQKGPR